MSSSGNENEEPSSSTPAVDNGPSGSGGENGASQEPRPPAKRRLSNTVIEISDTESDDSDICAVTSYQASADEVKKIRGADYSSSSSSSDYSSDSESPWEDDSIILEDEKTDRKPVKAQLYHRANRMEDPKLNDKLKTEEVIDRLTTHWKEQTDLKSDETSLTCEPFPVCMVHNFLSNPDIINNIVDDMNTLDWTRKKMDLYEFHQTADLASLTWQRSIRGIHDLLKTEVMSWVSKVTGLELTSVSAACSLYGPGDRLLVHDDLLGDRRVAFILYLAPWTEHSTPFENGDAEHQTCEGWSPAMGGALQLFSQDEAGQPAQAVRSITPRNNSLAFFQVSHRSYHQVEEVVSLELPRLSINGWFHGPAPPEPPPPPPPPPALQPDMQRAHNEVVLLNQWVDAAYMSPRARAQVQAQMERCSEACLHGLLQPAKRQALLEALAGDDIPWERCGPANQRRYERVPAAWAAAQDKEHPVRALLRLLASAAFVRLLADCCDLPLGAAGRLELQRWAAADYTLLPPREQYQHERLEVVYYLGVARALAGGATSYVAPEDAAGDALVTLPPKDNSLGMVYCDAGATSFTHYVSRLSLPPGECFYILTCTYTQ